MRMCVACREMRAKKDLMRIVRTAEGELVLDLTGKLSGRGAYLCRDAACLNKAIKIRALERALEAPLNDTVKAAMESEIETHDGPAV
ncbi:MAG: YlxR family protein [Clostridia bacterium]|jgi:predicted RNA-binding protein YlxR (DUF448 family)|nr:YlxR family protein [Clostridia bacterium]MDO4836469.1 YlxR family protein [Clostridia bacterium]